MENEENLIKVFTGAESIALLLLKMLEEAGVKGLIKNDSGLGYLGAAPSVLELYILETDIDKAMPLVREFTETNEPEQES